MRGHFITFEGGEGSGKSTHAATLAQKLKSVGQNVVLTREPGGSTGAEIIRHILLSGIAKPLGAETEAILFAAARDDHVRNTILPALKSGTWVICDRFIDLTRVYQGALGNVDERLIPALERVTVGPAVPELTFHSRCSGADWIGAREEQAWSKQRPTGSRQNRWNFMRSCAGPYRALAAAEPKRCVVIDATRREAVHRTSGPLS